MEERGVVLHQPSRSVDPDVFPFFDGSFVEYIWIAGIKTWSDSISLFISCNNVCASVSTSPQFFFSKTLPWSWKACKLLTESLQILCTVSQSNWVSNCSPQVLGTCCLSAAARSPIPLSLSPSTGLLVGWKKGNGGTGTWTSTAGLWGYSLKSESGHWGCAWWCQNTPRSGGWWRWRDAVWRLIPPLCCLLGL